MKYVQEDKSQRFVFSGIQCQMLKDQKNCRRQMQYSYYANGEKKQRVDGEWMDAEDMILSENEDENESGSESDRESSTPDNI